MKLNNQSLKKIFFWILLLALTAAPFILTEIYFYIKFNDEFGKFGYTKEHLSKGRVQDSPYCIFEPIPNTLNLKSGFKQNNYGFRDEDDTKEKRPNEFRIFILGGSGAIGQGASKQFIKISGQQEYASKYTISSYLEEKLQDKYPLIQIEVINAAVSGYTINQEYSFYMSTIRKLNPDLLILIDGYNDMNFPLDGKFYRNDLDRSAWTVHPYKTNFTYKYGMYLMSKSYSFFYIGKQLFTSKYEYDEKTFHEWLNQKAILDTATLNTLYSEKILEIEYGINDIFKRYEIFKRTCEVDGVDILYCPQPLLTLKPNKTEVEKSLNNYLLSWLTDRGKLSHHNIYNYFLTRFEVWANDQKLNYINLQKEINSSDRQIFVDYCHLSFLGNELIAELIKKNY